ncbi:MAG: dihydrolipoyl dehydrogenase [Polyangiaceae bacterium]|nr:dihydrolipoyl dehydrogenase [Polyangiaceae bacterium]
MSTPAPSDTAARFDLAVLGGGPGGYVAAIRAAQLGLRVACVEQEPALGGTCLRVGCIPSKALLESSERYAEAKNGLLAHGVRVASVELDLAAMHARRQGVVKTMTQGIDFLFKKHGITRVVGRGSIAGPGRLRVEGETPTELQATHVLLATGSRVVELPGVELDGDRVGTSTEALAYPEVPGHLVVIGAGYIGLELGSVWSRLGAKVTILEYLDRVLPGMDSEIANEARRTLAKQGLEFRLGTRVVGARAHGDRCVVEIEGAASLECDRVLSCAGRAPRTAELGLEAVGIRLDDRGRIEIDDRFRTTAPGFYAVGDVVRGPMLAHKASEEGVACVEWIVNGWGHVGYDAIPGIVYTHPEVATVGKSEDELKAAGVPHRKGVFPFSANGRARALGQAEGRVKVLAHAETDRILGVHVIGPRAGDLIAEAAVAIELGASSEDLARSCHAHPTLAESLKEAALAVDGRALHV